jgi:hypothetical protein
VRGRITLIEERLGRRVVETRVERIMEGKEDLKGRLRKEKELHKEKEDRNGELRKGEEKE